MEKYASINLIGSGSFGRVWRAVNKQSGEVVAIKVLKKKYSSWEECLNLREVKCLRKLNHSNILQLKELVRRNEILYFVFEHMDCNLLQLIESRKDQGFSEAEIRKWCFQVFQGLHYMHQQGYFHRDLKPENLLVKNDIIKIADFGQAREINSRPPYTVRISTRWYRAPELLLRSRVYSSKVDMWAIGAVMAEFFTLCPLFPGITESNQIHKICGVIGSPTVDSWSEGLQQARAQNYQFSQCSGVNLSSLMPSASESAISLISSLCSWDPCKRPTAAEALQHPFFQSRFHFLPPHLLFKPAVAGIAQSPETSRTLQKQSATTHSEALPGSKLDSNFSSPYLSPGVQQISAKQQNCYPTPGKIANGVLDTPTSFANLTIAPHRLCCAVGAALMKTGVRWNAEPGNLYRRPILHLTPADYIRGRLAEKN